ncbi:TetR/AcrR family transcriptional regulator, partial [Streptomyces sp. NPDC057580]|uniref:TetR/AcrR family transcriptional regulator n=1 Tax=Streptomyces sp. NPDC057580 TaxID=3346173 RepID=UPI0036AD90FD
MTAGRRGKAARRAELNSAVQRALFARGLEGLRLRDVADEAGVTPAAVLYYGDLDALAYETYQQAIERHSQERERAAEQFTDARDQLRACIDYGPATGPEGADPTAARVLAPLPARPEGGCPRQCTGGTSVLRLVLQRHFVMSSAFVVADASSCLALSSPYGPG